MNHQNVNFNQYPQGDPDLDTANESVLGFLKMCDDLRWESYTEWQHAAALANSIEDALVGTNGYIYNYFSNASRRHHKYYDNMAFDEKKLTQDFTKLHNVVQAYANKGYQFNAKIKRVVKSNPLATKSKPQEITATYLYYDLITGKEYRKTRVVTEQGKKFWWDKTSGKIPAMLYKLPELRKASLETIVFVAEGEKCVDYLTAKGLLAVCSHAGSSTWPQEFAKEFTNRLVVILSDNDCAGHTHAKDIFDNLSPIAASVKVVNLSGLGEKEDVYDWLTKYNHTTKELLEVAELTPAGIAPILSTTTPQTMPLANEYGNASPNPKAVNGKERQPTQADKLVNLLEALEVELFHTEGMQKAFASIEINNHIENWAIRSTPFKHLLIKLFRDYFGGVPSSQAIEDTLRQLEASANYDGKELPVYIKFAEYEGDIYMDLVNDSWQYVKISKTGWQVVSQVPVKFIRKNGMLRVPTPTKGGKLSDLMNFVNVSPSQWILAATWLVAAVRPTGPYPILNFNAEQGCAKSLTSYFFRTLIDPVRSPLRETPKEIRDFWITAQNSWVACFDNLSGIPSWFSDSLCRLATGGGSTTRALFTDDDEIYFDAQRPIILNGIDSLPNRSDLLERCIILDLPVIEETKRKTETSLKKAFEAARPQLLGSLLDAVSVALQRVDTVELEKKPRMADFAVWAVAAEPALCSIPSELTFLEAYTEQKEDSNATALEASLFSSSFTKWFELLANKGGFGGTATQLLESINHFMQDKASRENTRFDPAKNTDWPTTATYLSKKLKRLAPNLRAVGIDVKSNIRHKGQRILEIKLLEACTQEASICTQEYAKEVVEKTSVQPFNSTNKVETDNSASICTQEYAKTTQLSKSLKENKEDYGLNEVTTANQITPENSVHLRTSVQPTDYQKEFCAKKRKHIIECDDAAYLYSIKNLIVEVPEDYLTDAQRSELLALATRQQDLSIRGQIASQGLAGV